MFISQKVEKALHRPSWTQINRVSWRHPQTYITDKPLESKHSHGFTGLYKPMLYFLCNLIVIVYGCKIPQIPRFS